MRICMRIGRRKVSESTLLKKYDEKMVSHVADHFDYFEALIYFGL